MWEYTDKVLDHFRNPRNVGVIPDADGVGEVGSMACGDALKLTFKLGPDGRIIDAKFQTFGCASAIASSSALTEMIKGKTLEEAEKITNKDIAEYLGGLPEQKMHCSVMGREALEAAIANYRGGSSGKKMLQGKVVCKCFGVTEDEIERTVRENNLTTVEQVTHYTKAGGGCGRCKDDIQRILDRVREQLAAAREKEKTAYTDYDRRMDLTWAEASLANLVARIQRTRELNQLKVQAGEMKPAAARIADVELEQQQIRAEIELLEVRKKSEPLDSKRLEYAQAMIRLQGQLKDAEMIRLKLLEETGTFEEGLLAGLKRYTSAAMTAFQEGVYLAQGAARAMEQSFGTLFFDAMQGKLKRGVDYWRQFVASIEKMLSDLLAKKLMEQILGTQSQGAGGNYGGLIGMIASYFSSNPSSVQGTGQAATYSYMGAESAYGIMHGGRGPGEGPRFYRLVPAPLFESAPRFHVGKGEIPAIIRDDESVFTPAQLRALGRAQRAGGGDTYVTNYWNVSAIDAPSFRQFALRNKSILADAGRAAAKDTHPARRGG